MRGVAPASADRGKDEFPAKGKRVEITAANVWMMVSAALVLLMTPALGLFYGGMTRAKASLNMIMMSFVSAGIVGVVWVLWGYSMSTGEGVLGLFGNPFASFGLSGLMGTPDLIKAGFAGTFAILTVALISGAIADRAKFTAWVLFVPLWITAVYCPLAFMVWGGGLMSQGGAVTAIFGQVIDFAGGTVVEISSGVAALVLALIVGKRHGFGKDPGHRPHNVPFIMLGAGLLWFGWFGFNAGAATTAEQAGLIWINTLVTPCAAMLSWLLTEKVRHGHPTSLGAASGAVAGLVAITPSCANISPVAAIGLGLVVGRGVGTLRRTEVQVRLRRFPGRRRRAPGLRPGRHPRAGLHRPPRQRRRRRALLRRRRPAAHRPDRCRPHHARALRPDDRNHRYRDPQDHRLPRQP